MIFKFYLQKLHNLITTLAGRVQPNSFLYLGSSYYCQIISMLPNVFMVVILVKYVPFIHWCLSILLPSNRFLLLLSINSFYNYFLQGRNTQNCIQHFKHLQFTTIYFLNSVFLPFSSGLNPIVLKLTQFYTW